jgi:phage baseplate assembly protein gpV
MASAGDAADGCALAGLPSEEESAPSSQNSDRVRDPTD